MLKTSLRPQSFKRARARSLLEDFPAMVKHKCTVKADHHCVESCPTIGRSLSDGELGQCPYCKRLVSLSEKGAPKL
jgi:hypothetical protein